MAYNGFTVTLAGATPTRVDVPQAYAEATLVTGGGVIAYGNRIILTNTGPGDIRLGGPTVTADNGYRLHAGDTFTDTPTSGDRLYAIALSGTAICEVLRGGLTE